MKKPTIILEDPADTLLEFVETLASIKVTPEKIEKNSDTMIGADGELITY